MNIKDLAQGARYLQRDDTFCYIMESIKKDKANIFLNPNSSIEEREAAHYVVCALSEVENRIATILADEAVYDKKIKGTQNRGNA